MALRSAKLRTADRSSNGPYRLFFLRTPPYGLFGHGNRLEEIAANTRATITYKPFDLITLLADWWATATRTGYPRGRNTAPIELPRRPKKRVLPFNLKPAIGQPTARLHPMRSSAAQKRRRRCAVSCASSHDRRLGRGTLILPKDEVRPRLP